jgi:hypothetical protein
VPAARWQGHGDVIGAQPTFAAWPGRDAVGAGDGQHIAQAEGGGFGAEELRNSSRMGLVLDYQLLDLYALVSKATDN